MGVFKYGTDELDSDKLAKYLHDNVNGWIDSTKFKGNEEVRSAINDMIGRVQSGDIDSLDYSGTMHSNSDDYTNNSQQKHLINFNTKDGKKGIIRTGKTLDTHGLAARYLNDALTAYSNGQSKKQDTETTKNKFNATDLIQKTLTNRWLGGEATDESLANWRGNRDKAQLYGDIMSGIQSLNDYDYSNYDFKDSPFKDADDFKSRLSAIQEAYDKQDWEGFNRAYSAVGGRGLVGYWIPKDEQATEEDPTDLEIWEKEERARLKKSGGYTPEQIESMIQAGLKSKEKERQKAFLETTEDDDWNKYIEGLTGGGTWEQQFDNVDLNKSGIADKYLGWYDKEGDQTTYHKGIFSDKKLPNQIMQALKRGDLSQFGDNANNHVRMLIRQLLNDNAGNKHLTPTKNGQYIINETVDENTGSAIVYDTINKRAFRANIGKNTPVLKSILKNKWKRQRYATYNKEGGILKALDGATFANNVKKEAKARQLAEFKKEAAATGKTVDEVRADNSYAFSTKEDLAKNGVEGGLNNSDYLRLASLVQDLASIGASYAGPGGMAASGVLGLTSLGTDFAADLTDNTVSAGDMWKNVATNAGWAALGMIPGANSSKLAKVTKSLVKYAPLAYGVISTLQNGKEIKKSWDKLTSDPTKLTTKDFKNLAYTVKLIAGGHHVVKSDAGRIGINYGANNKAARAIGAWGNNAWSGKGKNAYFRAMSGKYQKPGIIPLNEDNTVTIGGQRVNPETAAAMQKAAKSMARSGATGEQIKQAAIDAYKNSAEGKAQIGTATEAVRADRFADFKALRQAMRGKADAEGNYSVNGQKVNAQQLQDLKSAYLNGIKDNASKTHVEQSKAGLEAVNTKFGEMFDKPAVPANPIPEFNFGEVSGTNGWFRTPTRLWRGNLSPESNAPGLWAKTKNFIAPEREGAFNVNTEIGKNNFDYIRSIRKAYGKNQPKFGLANNIEYNMGFGLTGANLNQGVQSAKAQVAKTREEHKTEVAKAKQLADLKKQKAAQTRATNAELKDVNAVLGTSIKAKHTESVTNIRKQIKDYATAKGLSGKSTKEILAEVQRQATAEGRSPKSVLRNPTRGSNTAPTRIKHAGPIEKSFTNSDGTQTHKLSYNILNKSAKSNSGKKQKYKANRPSVTGSTNGKRKPIESAYKELHDRGARLYLRNPSPAVAEYMRDKLGIPKGSSRNPVKINEIWKDASGNYYYWKQGGKVPFLQSGGMLGIINDFTKGLNLTQPTIPEDLQLIKPEYPQNNSVNYSQTTSAPRQKISTMPSASMPRFNWYDARWRYHALNGWRPDLDSSLAKASIAGNKWHKFGNDLTAPYLSNKAYTDNSKVVGEDLNSYYNSNYKGKSLTDYVQGYNSDLDNLNQFFDNDLSYSTADSDIVRAHGQSFKAMYPNRSGNTDNDWDLGYSVPNEGQLGTTMWARRGDQYETEFDKLSDDQKKSRIHKIGDLGYVYKMANGKIGVVDDATLQRLGYIQGNPTKPDGGSEVKSYNESITKQPSQFSGFLDKLGQGIDPNLAQVPLGLAANKRMLNLALNKKVALDSYSPVHRSVMGNYSGLQSTLNQAGQTEQLGNRIASNISDASTAAATRLQSNANANNAVTQGQAAYDNSVMQSKEAAWQQNKENSARLDAITNENNMRLTQKFNADQDARMAADPYNNVWKPFIMDQSYKWQTGKADRKNNAIALAKINLDNYQESELAPLLTAYNNNPTTENYNKYQSKLKELRNSETFKQLTREMYKAYGYDLSKLRDFSNTGTSSFTKAGDLSVKPVKNKEGGKIQTKSGNRTSDDGPVKTRSKDADRFQKAIKAAADSHDKKLARLANAYMASFKRTMGK